MKGLYWFARNEHGYAVGRGDVELMQTPHRWAAARVAACLNACDGIDDPAAELPAVRDHLSGVLSVLPYAVPVLEGVKKDATAKAVRECCDQLRAASARLHVPDEGQRASVEYQESHAAIDPGAE